MTAKPAVVGAIEPETARVPVSVMNGIVAKLEDNELEIQKLKNQKAGLLEKLAVLQLQKTEAEIRLQNQLLKVHADYLDRLTALEEAQDRTGNLLQPLVGLRDEFERVRESVSGLLAREVI